MGDQQALAIVENSQAVAILGGGANGLLPVMVVPGMEALTREDIAIPRLVLVQLTSKKLPDDYLQHFGEWYNTVTGEYAPEIEGILLGIAKQRTAFPRDFSDESRAMCASDNALYARAEFVGNSITDSKLGVTHSIDGSCAECPFSKFTGEVTPLCSMGYVYGFYDLHSMLPVIMRAQRTGIKAARQLNMQIKRYGRANTIVISATKVKDANGHYAVPVFSAGEKLTLEMANAAAKFCQDFGNIAERVSVLEDEVPQGGNGASEPPDDDYAPPF